MGLLQRAVASVVLLSTALSTSITAPHALAKAHDRDRPSHGRWSDRHETGPPAAAFARGLAASIGAGMAPGGRGSVRAVPRGGLRGIDVSHYQGRIDWRRVARSGNHFAIAKATEGRTYVDRTYLRNKASAESIGLTFGAYHFARPDRGPHDAIREANHFLDVARLEPGNVLPVLDLESTGGLSHRQLTRWILKWLRRVRQRLGVRPMIYTSPTGWAQRTGNTTRIADAGYDVLWVAHWGVREPALPARNWGGHGWALWQRNACGSVPGIRGCVDVNRLAGPSLDPLTIDVADTRPPTVRVAPATSSSSPVVVSFDEVVGHVSPRNVFLRATGGGPNPNVRIACRSGIGSYADCEVGDVRKVLVTPRRPLVPGQTYQAVVNPASASRAVADRAGNPAPAAGRTFAAPTDLEQGSAPIAYARPRAWRILSRGRRPGGRVAASAVAGASAELTFFGTGLGWTTVTGPNHGRAAIWVDGRYERTVDTFARSRNSGVEVRVTDLVPGVAHTVRIVVLGEADPRAGGTVVAVDGFSVLRRRFTGRERLR